MNRRQFLRGLGAALLAVPFLPAPIKEIATRWTKIGFLTMEITHNDDGTVSVSQVGDIKWSWVEAPPR